MALDRFVYLKDEKPTREQLEQVLRNYIGEAGTINFENNMWFCTLPGKPTHLLQGVDGFPQERCVPLRDDERWFEIFYNKDDPKPHIDVITRQQDEFTTVVANGFQQLCARIWKGEMPPQ